MKQLFSGFTKQNIIRAVTASVIIGLLYSAIKDDRDYARNAEYATAAIQLAEQYQANAKRYELFRVAYLKNCKCMQNASIEEIDAAIDAELTAVVGGV